MMIRDSGLRFWATLYYKNVCSTLACRQTTNQQLLGNSPLSDKVSG